MFRLNIILTMPIIITSFFAFAKEKPASRDPNSKTNSEEKYFSRVNDILSKLNRFDRKNFYITGADTSTCLDGEFKIIKNNKRIALAIGDSVFINNFSQNENCVTERECSRCITNEVSGDSIVQLREDKCEADDKVSVWIKTKIDFAIKNKGNFKIKTTTEDLLNKAFKKSIKCDY